MSRSLLLAFAVSSLLAGCTVTSTPASSSGLNGFPVDDNGAKYAYLFDSPRSAPTPNSMTGIWAREDADGKYRYELKAGELIIGGQCGDLTVGNDDPATFTNDRMATTKNLFIASNHNGKQCGVSFPELDAKKCVEGDKSEAACFTLSGTSLTLKNTADKDVVLTKISD
jgi:hypothetical protein